MILRSLAAIAVILTFTIKTGAIANEAAPADEKLELRCAKPLDYDFSIDIRNSLSQGGTFDGRLFIFLNGSYRGGQEVSRWPQAFGKGDVTYAYINERAWEHCQTSPDHDALRCDLDRPNQTITLWGKRGFDGPEVKVMQMSKFTMFYRLDEAKIGHFRFNVVEAETGVQHNIEYELPCG